MNSKGARHYAARMALGFAMLVAVPAVGMAEVITFGSGNTDPLLGAGPQVEGSFTYQATIGEGWEILNNAGFPEFGNEPSALATAFNGESSEAGDVVEIKLTGGGTFRFESVDFRTLLDSNSDDVLITGFLGVNPTGTLGLTGETVVFQTVASGLGFTGAIDLLRIEITGHGGNVMFLDNFVLNPAQVPEPSSLALLLLGALGLLDVARRNRSPS